MTLEPLDPEARRLLMTVPHTFRQDALKILRRLQFDSWLAGWEAAKDGEYKRLEEAVSSRCGWKEVLAGETTVYQCVLDREHAGQHLFYPEAQA